MPTLNHNVMLSDAEEKRLNNITHKGSGQSAKVVLHAQILLLSNDHYAGAKKKTNREICEILNVSASMVNSVRKTYAEGGLDAALKRKSRVTPAQMIKITGDFEAHVLAMALGPPPAGRARWTLRLLAEYASEKEYIVAISHTALGDMLNTNQVKPHLSAYWCTPKERDAEFVMRMEDVLGIYQMGYDPQVPVICMDEKPQQLLGEIRERACAKPLSADPDTGIETPGRPVRIDSEYVRNGTSCIFMFTEPLGGWRHVVARKFRKKEDFAFLMREIREKHYPDAKKIILVADNLNTHNPAAFYEAFEPKTAFDLARAFEFHYTPKHGSWLNIAESELSVLSTQCLGNRRIKGMEELNEDMKAWEADRNKRQKGVNWQFSLEDARVKLKRLYPTPIFPEKDQNMPLN